MRLYHSRLAEAGLDHIRIYRALHQEVHSADLFRFFLEYTDKFLADDLPLLLRFRHTCELFIKTLLRIDPHEIQVIFAVRPENSLDLVALVLPQKTVVNEHTC